MRIEQNQLFLNSLMHKVRSGQIAPAAFQRPYVWGRPDVVSLCQSIVSGYPIGGFLSWAPHKDVTLEVAARPRLGAIALETQQDPRNVEILLDGQNRLASIAWMSRDFDAPLPADLSPMEEETWGGKHFLAYDLESFDFVWELKQVILDSFMIPAWAFVQPSSVVQPFLREQWAGSWSDRPEAERDRALIAYDKISTSFSEARVTETVLRNATAAEARHAFLHICKVGVPMSKEDFDAAIGLLPATELGG